MGAEDRPRECFQSTQLPAAQTMTHVAGFLQALSSLPQLSAWYLAMRCLRCPCSLSPVSLNSLPNYFHWTSSHLQFLLWITSPALWPSARPFSDISYAYRMLLLILFHVGRRRTLSPPHSTSVFHKCIGNIQQKWRKADPFLLPVYSGHP